MLVNNDADVPDAGTLASRVACLLLSGSAEPRHAILTTLQQAVLVGRYQLAPGDIRVISERNGVLQVQRNDNPPLPLATISSTELTLVDSEGAFLLSFEIGDDGRAARMRAPLRCEPVDVATRIAVPSD